MSKIVSEEPAGDMHSEGSGETVDTREPIRPERPTVTFKGNTYDLMSLGSLVVGALILFSCLTCNLGYYLLPLISGALGIIGLLTARQSVEPERTRLLSWLGIAATGAVLFFILAAIVLYIGLVVIAIATGQE